MIRKWGRFRQIMRQDEKPNDEAQRYPTMPLAQKAHAVGRDRFRQGKTAGPAARPDRASGSHQASGANAVIGQPKRASTHLPVESPKSPRRIQQRSTPSARLKVPSTPNRW